MSNRLHLRKIATTAVLIATPVIALFLERSARAQSLPPVATIPAAPGNYDFQWEKFEARAAPGGKAFYIFEGKQPVGIGAAGTDGKPEIFPIVSGAAAEELRASFERLKRAKSVGVTFLSKTSRTPSIALSNLPAKDGGGTPRVAFDNNGSHVSLTGGTNVDFLAAGIEVTMPAASPGFPATRIVFNSQVERGAVAPVAAKTEIIMNGSPINRQRSGPVWEGLKALVLKLALGRAGQAAQIASNAPGRPADAPDYIALVADIQKHLN